MKQLYLAVGSVALLLCSASATSAVPANVPPGMTALCKDGTFYNGTKRAGACRGHKGVKEWYGAAAAKGKAGATTLAPPAGGTTAQPDSPNKQAELSKSASPEKPAQASVGSAETPRQK